MALELKKTTFLSPGTKVAKTPRQIKIYSGEDPILNIYYLIFGPWGSGKTHAVSDLLMNNYKVFLLSTDNGGANGLNTIRVNLNTSGNSDKLKNLRYIQLDNKDDVEDFLEAPLNYFPELWEFNPDFLVWEGFSNYQQNYVKVEFEDGDRIEDRRHWDVIKNLTIRPAEKFLAINKPELTSSLHKILTCQENYKSVEIKNSKNQVEGSELKESRSPLLQGAGGKHLGAAFDMILRTTVIGKDGEEPVRYYVTQGNENLAAKKRFKLAPKVAAEFTKLHLECLKQLQNN